MTRIHLSPPDVGELEERFLVDALRSGWAAPLGPHVDAFEAELAERLGAGHAVALNSGTAALHLALLTAGVGPGDVVVAPSMTFVATTNAIVYTGAEPFFVDSEPESGNIDPELLDEALSDLASRGRRVPVIVPVDLLGQCVDQLAIGKVAEQHGVRILADSAESLGAVGNAAPAGSWGDWAALSFNGNKVMTTSGGGMLLTDDDTFASHVRYLSTQARQPAAHYEHTDVGYNYRLSNLLAAVGRAQLRRLDEMIARRAEVRQRYAELFDRLSGARLLGDATGAAHNCWLTAVIVDPAQGWRASDLAAHLASLDVESRPLWKPMHRQPAFAACQALVNGTSDKLFKNGLALPSGSGMSDECVEWLMSTIATWLASHA